MKATNVLIVIPIVLISLFSCNTSQPLVEDNVYMMKASNLPVDADLLDETSYATYKYRANKDIRSTEYFYSGNPLVLSIDPRAATSSFFWRGPFYSYAAIQGNFNPFWGLDFRGFTFNECGWYYGCNYTPYHGYQSAGGSGWNEYNNSIGISNGFFNNGNNFSSNSKLIYSAPRATNSGYYSGNNRGGNIQLKNQSSYTNSSSSIARRENLTSTKGERNNWSHSNSTANRPSNTPTQSHTNVSIRTNPTSIQRTGGGNRPSMGSGSARPSGSSGSSSPAGGATRTNSAPRSGGRGN